MTSIKDILKRPFTYQLVLKEQIRQIKNLLHGIKQETHGERRRFYEQRMGYIEMHVDTIKKIKQGLEPYLRDTSIQKIDEYFGELLQLFNEIAKELNKSRVSTLETIARDQFKKPNISFDPSIGENRDITDFINKRKDSDDYLGGKKKRRTTRRKRTIRKTRTRKQ
jgi:hypothetical protein